MLIPTPQLAVWLLVVARRELWRASKIDLLGFLSSYWGLWAVATVGAYLLALIHTAVVLRVSSHLYPGVLMLILLACGISDYYALRKLLLSLMLFYS